MRPDFRDVMFAGGWVLFAYGLALVSVPAGLIGGGLVLMGVAVLSLRRGAVR